MHIDYETTCPRRPGEEKKDLPALDMREKLEFIHDGGDRFFGHYSSFEHLFHCVSLFLFLFFNAPHFAEAAPSDNVVELEVVLGDRWDENEKGRSCLPTTESLSFSLLKLQFPIFGFK